MQFNVVTLFPEMFVVMDHGIIGRAQERDLIDIKCWNPRDYTKDKYRKVDDTPYGGGPGMVMMVQPMRDAILAARENSGGKAQLVYLSPQGKMLNNNIVIDLAVMESLILVAGRYEGIDERLMDIESGIEISIGDYVLSGGELPSMVLIDAITRHIPGVMGDADSVKQDSFAAGLLDYPHYTRPEEVSGHKVPAVLLGGNHAEIELFRRKQSLGATWLKRPDLLKKIELTETDRMLLNDFIKNI